MIADYGCDRDSMGPSWFNVHPVQLAVSLVSGLAVLMAVQPLVAAPAPPSLQQQAEEVAARLEGTMDTSAQAKTNPKFSTVYMTTCRITLQGKPADDSIFLYQEQSLQPDQSKPYRQRFLQLSVSPYSQSVRSQAFRPKQLQRWAGFCNQPAADRQVSVAELGQPVCSVFLRRSGENYIGNTPADGCPANVRGAVRITNHIVLYANGMDTWDRGFDAQGKQVWGAQSISYQFRRQ